MEEGGRRGRERDLKMPPAGFEGGERGHESRSVEVSRSWKRRGHSPLEPAEGMKP